MVVYQNDHIGTPQKITAVNGAVVWSAKYDSFGKATIDPSSTIENCLRFAGQYEDSETGLSYNWKRYYNPTAGRYQRTDPIGLRGGINLFRFVQNNPIITIDPNGLSGLKIIKLCAKGYKVVKKVGFKEAVKAIRRGEDVLADSHSLGKKVAKAAGKKKRPIRDPAHGEGYMKHYHPNPRTGSHVFYEIAAALTVANYVNCEDCAEAYIAEVIDFFNPLSLPNDTLEIIDTVRE